MAERKFNTSGDNGLKSSDVKRLLSQVEVRVRSENAQSSVLAREWAVVTAVGSAILRQMHVSQIIEKHPELSEATILETWQLFMNKGVVAAEFILNDLQQPAPKRVMIDFESASLANGKESIAGIVHNSGEVLALKLHVDPLMNLFLQFLLYKAESNKVYVLKKFEAILAHEFYHIFQINRYPAGMNREQELEYLDRRTEYAARLYSLRHLQRQTATTDSNTLDFSVLLGLWRSRAHILLHHLSSQNHVRDRVSKHRPSIMDHFRAVFQDDPRRVPRKLR